MQNGIVDLYNHLTNGKGDHMLKSLLPCKSVNSIPPPLQKKTQKKQDQSKTTEIHSLIQ